MGLYRGTDEPTARAVPDIIVLWLVRCIACTTWLRAEMALLYNIIIRHGYVKIDTKTDVCCTHSPLVHGCRRAVIYDGDTESTTWRYGDLAIGYASRRT